MLPFLSEWSSQEILVHGADVLIRVTVVLSVGGGIGFCLRRQSASFRHGWWLTTLLAAVFVPVASLVMPGWGPANPLLSRFEPAPVAATSATTASPPETAAASTASSDAAVASSPTQDGRVEKTRPRREQGTPRPVRFAEKSQTTEITRESAAVDTEESVEPVRSGNRPSAVLICLIGAWLVGFLFVLLQTIFGWRRLSRLVRGAGRITERQWRRLAADVMAQLGVRRSVELRQSLDETGPLTGGLINPFVLLPAGCDTWPTERKQVVLLHELAHVKRRDVLSLWCSRLVAALLWFHPLVWLVIHRLRIEGERSCDDLVLAAGTRPSTYSQHLVEIASAYRCSRWIAATAMTIAGRSPLEGRIRCVLDETRNRCSMSIGAALAAVLLSLGIATTVATAGRVVVRDAAGKAVATLDIPEGGSVTVELDGNSAAQRKPEGDGERSTRFGGQWPQWGGTPQRNNASPATNLPDSWDVKTGENILWSAELGSQTYGTPVIADGKIFIGTNNGHGYLKRFPKQTDLGCLLCFDVETGKFLWQHSNKKLETGRVHDWPLQGIVSTPVVQGNRLYYVTNRAVVTCLDTGGLRDGNAGPVQDEHDGEFEADVVWRYDLMKELGVSPKNISGCSPTTDGLRLFVTTSNGTGESYVDTPSPDAPSFVCLELKTGKLLWSAKAAFAARDCQWSGPSVGTFVDRNGKRQTQVLFPGSDGWLYSFDPEGDGHGNARLLWKFDCNPKDARYFLGGSSRRNLHVSMPVIHDGLVYVATGRNPEQGEGEADLWCIDPNRKTPGADISEFLVSDKNGKPLPVDMKSYYDKKQGHKKRANPDSGVVWHYTATDRNGDGRTEFEETFHRTWGNPVIHHGLLVVSDFSGLVHCLRADSGKFYWTYDTYAMCWSSPLAADGRIFAADEDGDVAILKLDQTLKLVEELNCGNGIYSTPVAVGDTLFVATKTRLLAIRKNRAPVVGSGNLQGAAPGTAGPSSHSDEGRRRVATSLPENLKLRWKLPSADGWASSATIVGNHVYAASLAGELYCVDVHSGSVVWKYRSLDDTDPEESAPGFTSAPRVAGDAVYVGDEDGLFHAVDRATGKRKWVLETGDAITGRAAVADDRIVFGSYDSYLYCVNTEGSLLWKFQTEDRIHGSPAMAGEYALVAGCDQHVRVIDVSAGEQVADISLDSYLIASPAVAGDEFYIGTYAGDVVAVNWKDGRIAWQYKYEKRVSPYHASASVTDSRVFVGGRDKQFHCLNRSNGARVWTFSARAPINSSSAVVGDRVFFGCDDGNLYGLRTSDGKEVWRFRAGRKITAGVAAGDGHLVVGEEGPNGNLYCFAAEG